MRTSESTMAISDALTKFQAEVTDPKKNNVNPAFKSKYANLDDTIKAIRDTAKKYGLSFIQSIMGNGTDISVVTRIMHTSGEFIESDPFTLHADKPTAQGAGSAVTYARRYSLSSMFGLATDDDDDGNGAEQHSKKVAEDKNKERTALLDAPVALWPKDMIEDWVFIAVKTRGGVVENVPVKKLLAAGENGAKALETIAKMDDRSEQDKEIALRAATLARAQ